MDVLVSTGRLHAPLSVKDEIKDSAEKETLAKWCRKQSGFYIVEDKRVQQEVKKLMHEYQDPLRTKGIGGADPFVIGLAIVNGANWRVVSSESAANGKAQFQLRVGSAFSRNCITFA